jgi:pyrroloquinoline quinone (PQQ) biosynthesis protein C
MRPEIERQYRESTTALTQTAEFQSLESGTASRDAYDRFIANVVRSHARSPKILAFLYAVAPPAATADLLHNMLEELGIEEEDGTSHPDLLKNLAIGAGLGDLLPRLEERANEDMRQIIVDPLLYGSFREVGFAVLVETVAYEWMLSRTASRIARFLKTHRGLNDQALEWFTHHSEVDIQHAEQGLDSLEKYAAYYDFSPEDALTIVEMTLRENVFIKRYFGELTLERTAAMG